MKKYRVKLNDRVLGPLSAEQIAELYSKAHIQGEETCQEFPAGEWKIITDFPELVDLISNLLSQEEVDPEAAAEKQVEVFDYSGTAEESESTGDDPSVKIELVETPIEFPEAPDVEEEEEVSERIQKTVIVKLPQNANVEKTVVVKREDLIKETEKKEETPKVVVEKKPEVSADEATAMFDLSMLDDLKDEVVENVEELERQKLEEEYIADGGVQEKESATKKNAKAKKTNKKSTKKTAKKKFRPIILAVILGLAYLFIFDKDKEVVINPQYLNYVFPVAQPVIDARKAAESFREGMKHYKKDTYLEKVVAIKYFSASVSYQFRDNKAFNYLILTYAELLPNAKDQFKARSVLYKMIKISRAKILKDSNVAIGTALLYYYSGFAKTAYDTIENYLRADGKPTLKLYSYYLRIMIKANRFKNMDDVAKRLEKVKDKTPLVYIALAEYYTAEENYEEAVKIVKEGVKSYKTSVPLLLKYADIERDKGNLKRLQGILKLIEALGAGQSPVYYARFLEHLGTVKAISKDVTGAAKLYKLALTFDDSSDLRDKLSQLSLGGGDVATNLISESKVSKLNREISKLLEVGKFELALLKAVEAVDLAPNSVRANLRLADLQRQRGYFERAIKTLETLQKKYPQNYEVLYYLSLAYLDAYRIQDNKKLLVAVMNSKFSKTFYYASSLGRYYMKIDNFLLATKCLKKSIALNPLNHKDYFALAELYFKYGKFKEARLRVGEAIALAPMELEYKIFYAKIYYEVDGTDAAIGYLRNILKKYPDNARLLGEIAVYYYRSGQIKAFERYKKKIDGLFNKDANFYSFLFKMAKIEGDKSKAINYGLKVIQLSSGDIDLLMELGSLYIDVDDYKNAINVFNDVIERMPTYPKVHYYLSEIYLKEGKMKEAEEEADKEIKQNSQSELGYYAKAKVMYDLKQYPVATKLLEKSISLTADFVNGLKLLALIKKQQNYLDQAKELYLRARNVDQGDAEIHKNLGEIYERTGQRSLAYESYKVYLEIDVNAPDRARIEAKMRRLK